MKIYEYPPPKLFDEFVYAPTEQECYIQDITYGFTRDDCIITLVYPEANRVTGDHLYYIDLESFNYFVNIRTYQSTGKNLEAIRSQKS